MRRGEYDSRKVIEARSVGDDSGILRRRELFGLEG